MKTARKAILLVLCVICLVVASVMGTLAYLTDTEAVTNTFSVGKVGINLDELDVDGSQTTPTPNTNPVRDKKNHYHLIPGEEYVKDPIVHVDADSESCYLYVQIVNDITAIEAAETEKLDDGSNYVPVATQITNNGWIPMGNAYPGLYYKVWTKGTSLADQTVFTNFKISDNATNTQLAAHAPVTTGEGANAVTTYKNIEVTAYAIQLAGFEPEIAADATEEAKAAANLAAAQNAWTALAGQLNLT